MKLLISLFDHSGNSSRPYKENGWDVIQVDIKLGIDILTWQYPDHSQYETVGIIAAVPCTDYALSGAKHFKAKDADGRTLKSQMLVKQTMLIVNHFRKSGKLQFWQVENPMSRIHTLNPDLGPVRLQFNPCDFALYDPNNDHSRYNKKTWLWGNFNLPIKKRLDPFEKENPGWKKLGGKSERTKELRSITPMGFAYAFYQFNH